MIDSGKIEPLEPDMDDLERANSESADADVKGSVDSWICHSYTVGQVEETVEEFNLLVDAIESRMPGTVPSTDESLLSEEELDAANIPDGFARSFLSQAKRPKFKQIAPGLSIPDTLSIRNQPFSSIEPFNGERLYEICPILLFRSSQLYNLPDSDPNGYDTPFGYPYSKLRSYPAGLYLADTSRGCNNEFEDAAKVVLPFGIGGKGFARKSDGSCFGEAITSDSVDPKDTYADLYQQGYNPFIEKHDVRLARILECWREMIENGDWKVGFDGVEGAIDAFKEADTEEGWMKFTLHMTW